MMGKASRQLDTDRAARNQLRRQFDSSLDQLKEDLTIGSVTSRIKRRAGETLDDAVAVADENRAVVAGTIAALGVWFLRRPILAWVAAKLADTAQTEDIADDGE